MNCSSLVPSTMDAKSVCVSKTCAWMKEDVQTGRAVNVLVRRITTSVVGAGPATNLSANAFALPAVGSVSGPDAGTAAIVVFTAGVSLRHLVRCIQPYPQTTYAGPSVLDSVVVTSSTIDLRCVGAAVEAGAVGCVVRTIICPKHVST